MSLRPKGGPSEKKYPSRPLWTALPPPHHQTPPRRGSMHGMAKGFFPPTQGEGCLVSCLPSTKPGGGGGGLVFWLDDTRGGLDPPPYKSNAHLIPVHPSPPRGGSPPDKKHRARRHPCQSQAGARQPSSAVPHPRRWTSPKSRRSTAGWRPPWGRPRCAPPRPAEIQRCMYTHTYVCMCIYVYLYGCHWLIPSPQKGSCNQWLLGSGMGNFGS